MNPATRAVWVLLAIWLTGVASAAAQPRRLAVVVGNNQGMADELDLRYSERDAEKVGRVLMDLGGYEPHQVHVLLGETAATVEELLEQVSFDSLDEDGLSDDELVLFFYYSGHSDQQHLHLSGTRLEIGQLKRSLEGTGARLNILVLDSCHSGAVTRAKGATLGPAYDIDFVAEPDVEGQIVITSSSADEISQESDRLEGSFFTHHLVSGLYGAADANEDSLVTLEEAYRYAHYRTVEHTIQSRGGVQHPSYRFDLAGQGNVVLANLGRSTARVEIVASPPAGEYYVLDVDNQLVLTEIHAPSNGSATVALPPGPYRIRKREPHRFLVHDVVAKAGSTVRVRDGNMEAVPYGDEGIKGGAQRLVSRHGPAVSMTLRNGLIPEMGPAWGFRLGYPLGGAVLFVEPTLGLRFVRLDDEGSTSMHNELDVGVGLGGRSSADRGLRWSIGAEASLLFFDALPALSFTEAATPPAGAIPMGLQFGVRGRMGIRLASPAVLFVAGNGGIALFAQDGVTRVTPVFGLGLGVSFDVR